MSAKRWIFIVRLVTTSFHIAFLLLFLVYAAIWNNRVDLVRSVSCIGIWILKFIRYALMLNEIRFLLAGLLQLMINHTLCYVLLHQFLILFEVNLILREIWELFFITYLLYTIVPSFCRRRSFFIVLSIWIIDDLVANISWRIRCTVIWSLPDCFLPHQLYNLRGRKIVGFLERLILVFKDLVFKILQQIAFMLSIRVVHTLKIIVSFLKLWVWPRWWRLVHPG